MFRTFAQFLKTLFRRSLPSKNGNKCRFVRLALETLEDRVTPSVQAAPVSFTTPHDQPLHIAVAGLLGNSSTDSGNSLSAILVTQPEHATVTNFTGDGSCDITPAPGYVGFDSFLIQVYDGVDYSDPVAANIEVTNSAPEVQIGDFTVLQNQHVDRFFASFADPDDLAGDFTASIDFGDGQTTNATIVSTRSGTFCVAASHVYTDAGSFSATITITDPLGATVQAHATATVLGQFDYTYTDPQGNQTRFIYAGDWQLRQEIDPLGNSTYYTWTGSGQLATRIDRLGREIDYAYNDAGKLTSESWISAAGATVETFLFTYDNGGELLSASNGSGTYTFSYLDGKLIGVTEPFGVSLTLGYDSAGNRTSVLDSFGGLTTSAYVDWRLSTRQFSDGVSELGIGLSYNSDGSLATIDRYSDVGASTLVASSAYTYFQGHIASVAHTDAASNVIDSFSYQFNFFGLISAETSQLGPAKNYTYDSKGQLTGDGFVSYAYDTSGNPVGSGIIINPGNQLLSDGTWNYTYDLEGNLGSKTNISTGETWTYQYDNVNHLTTAERRDANGTLLMHADYKYDAFGNRIEKTVWTPETGTATTRYALDGWNTGKPTPVGSEGWDVWAELDGNNALKTRYVNGDTFNQVFARLDENGVAWLLTDNIGSVRDVIDSSGAVIDHIDYGAFGNITYELNGAYGGHLLFTSTQFDSETGLYSSRARYLDPFTGRWTTEDPIGFRGHDSNLYRYVFNSPTNATDPSGNLLLLGGYILYEWAATGANPGTLSGEAWDGFSDGAALVWNRFSFGILYPDWSDRYRREGGEAAWYADYFAELGADAAWMAILDVTFGKLVNTQWFKPTVPTTSISTTNAVNAIAAMSQAERAAFQAFRMAPRSAELAFAGEAEALAAWRVFNSAKNSNGLAIGTIADCANYAPTAAQQGISLLDLPASINCSEAVNAAWLDGAAASRLTVRLISNGEIAETSRLAFEIRHLVNELHYLRVVAADGSVCFVPPPL